jgi:hypothetical protein
MERQGLLSAPAHPLEALAAKYACDKPAKTPKPLCAVAQVEEKGTAGDLRGQNTFVGLTWIIKRGKAGKAEVGTPRLSALALNKDSAGIWGAVTGITPQDAADKKMYGRRPPTTSWRRRMTPGSSKVRRAPSERSASAGC